MLHDTNTFFSYSILTSLKLILFHFFTYPVSQERIPISYINTKVTNNSTYFLLYCGLSDFWDCCSVFLVPSISSILGILTASLLYAMLCFTDIFLDYFPVLIDHILPQLGGCYVKTLHSWKCVCSTLHACLIFWTDERLPIIFPGFLCFFWSTKPISFNFLLFNNTIKNTCIVIFTVVFRRGKDKCLYHLRYYQML